MLLFLRLGYRCLLGGWLLRLLAAPVRAQPLPTFDQATRVLAPVAGPGSGRPTTQDVVVDALGNSYLSGYFSGTVRFGPSVLTTTSTAGYVVQLDARGAYRWAITLDVGKINFFDLPLKLALDAAGNLYVAGEFTSPTFALGATKLPNAGSSDLFLGKLNSANGAWLWALRAGGAGEENAHGLALDATGNAYVSGTFTGTTLLGSTTLTSAGVEDFFVARLTAAGSWAWALRGGGTGSDWTSELGLDATGTAYVAARFSSQGGQVGPLLVPGAATLLLRLAPGTGTPEQMGVLQSSLPDDYYIHLAVDAAGNCYVAGYFLGQLHLGNQTLTSVGRGLSNEDVFVAKLTAQGTWQWANVATGTSGEGCTSLAVDARGQVYLTGYFRGPGTQFGPTTLVPENARLFFDDVFVAKLDAQGTWLWALPAGGQQDDRPSSLALGPYATPHVVGEYFSPTMRFGALTIPGEPLLAASTFLTRLQPNLVTITGDSLLCNGGSTQLTARTLATAVSWRWTTGATTPSITVTQPGTYVVTATFAGGYQLTAQFRVQAVTPTVQLVGATSPLCPGTPRQLTAQAPGASAVRWNTGATTPSITVTQPGTYSVTASYGTGCTVSAQATLVANEVTITGRLQLCPGQSTLLTAVVTGSPVTRYQWSTGATTPTLLVGQAGTYHVTVFLVDGCQLTATHAVGPPVAKVASITGDTLLCAGTTLTLTALNPDALSYRWSTGATTPTIPVGQPGRYGVVLTFSGGCSSRDSLTVAAVRSLPAFPLGLGADTTLCANQLLVLHAPAVPGPGLTWRWSDGSTGPSLVVQAAGTYALELRTPCERRTLTRQVAFTSCLLIPTVITPNGDQRNDHFAFAHLPRGDWALTLYNRWGRQVYHTAAYQQDWGDDAPAGLYYYQLQQQATSASYRGWFEVIR